MEMRNANTNIHAIPPIPSPSRSVCDKKENEKNLLMHLNDIQPQAVEIYDFNWFGQAENSKSVVNTSGGFVLALWAFVICPRLPFSLAGLFNIVFYLRFNNLSY